MLSLPLPPELARVPARVASAPRLRTAAWIALKTLLFLAVLLGVWLLDARIAG